MSDESGLELKLHGGILSPPAIAPNTNEQISLSQPIFKYTNSCEFDSRGFDSSALAAITLRIYFTCKQHNQQQITIR